MLFESYRSYLFGLAYRMTGSVMDAEDIVQEAFLRVAQEQRKGTTIQYPKTYLSRMTTRLCLDYLKSAKVQRESYIGPWLPEPLITRQTPEDTTAEYDQISYGFLRLLEQLSPSERAILLLRDVFDYRYQEIENIVGKSEANCRQIYRRAKNKVNHGRPTPQPSTETQNQIIGQFMQAVLSGRIDDLIPLLTENITHYSDGGGNVSAATKPLTGAISVAKFFIGIARLVPPNVQAQFQTINGTQSIIFTADSQILNLINFTFVGDQISQTHAVLNPDKLQHL